MAKRSFQLPLIKFSLLYTSASVTLSFSHITLAKSGQPSLPLIFSMSYLAKNANAKGSKGRKLILPSTEQPYFS